MQTTEKSVGTLIDELVTARIKVEFKSSVEAHERALEVAAALDSRVPSLGKLVMDLVGVNVKCFMAQEIVMARGEATVVAAAAIQAQELNANRNDLMRRIDRLVGDREALGKTYNGSL